MPKLINLDRMLSRTQRPAPEKLPEWRPSKGSHHLLELLVNYRYLTAPLAKYAIDQLHERGGWQAQHELTRLWRHGFAQRFYQPTEPRTGSSAYVYTATPVGAQLIVPTKDYGAIRKAVWKRANERLSSFDHPLAITLLQLLWDLGSRELELAKTVPGGYWVDTRDPSDPVGGGFQVTLQAPPDAKPIPRPDGTRRKPEERFYRIFPDTTVLLDWDTHTWPIFFEIERTHKNERRQYDRMRAYVELLTRQHEVAGDVFQRLGYTRPRAGMVVFIASNDAETKKLWQMARDAVGSLHPRSAPAMLFGSLDSIIRQRTETDANGRERELEELVEPADFFRLKIFANLEGKRQPLLVRF